MSQMEIVTSILDKRGISYADFARLIDESPQTFSNWKSRGAIPGNKVAKVARALNVTADYLLARSDEQNDKVNESPADYDLAALIMAATPRSKASLERIAKAAEAGKLTDADIELLDTIAKRLEQK